MLATCTDAVHMTINIPPTGTRIGPRAHGSSASEPGDADGSSRKGSLSFLTDCLPSRMFTSHLHAHTLSLLTHT